jgi:hypothetical protein
LLWPFGFAIGLLVFGAMAVIIPPFATVAIYREFRLRRRYRRARQMREWADVCRRLNSGEGTLIVSIGPKKGPGHLWWMSDEVTTMFDGCPLPSAKAFAADYSGNYMRLNDAPNKDWCAMYLKDAMARGDLTHAPRRDFWTRIAELPEDRVRGVASEMIQRALWDGKAAPSPSV